MRAGVVAETRPGAKSDEPLASIEDAVESLLRGRMLVVVDAPDRENEGDLLMAAEHITPAAVNFMAKQGRGLICVPMLSDRLDYLAIPAMTNRNRDPNGTAFHVSVDHRQTTTGISVSDRALTIAALAEPLSRSDDFTQPGHVFPLSYRDGGVLSRAGHTEAAIDLMRIAGLGPTGVICEIAREDGEMARVPELRRFAEQFRLPMIAISDLISYRRRHDRIVERASQARIPLEQGSFTAVGYRDTMQGHEHVAFVYGDIERADSALVRVHSECLTGDVFRSQRCDCGHQLQLALQKVADEGAGVVIYLRGHEGRGIGLIDKLNAYQLQDGAGLDTVEANLHLGHAADERDYAVAAQILTELGIEAVDLLTNNPAKREGLERYGTRVVQTVPLVAPPTPQNVAYLATKQQRMGHRLGLGA
ncbi:MAG: bifunctional 3,4-dihydroxy-2-butanone-4-phosphate synthase/GTP cyclohydrolase II [Actinobacteria bacterium]|nr:bifunctional 3,4-dihydroxy-2-butanone-4-phosphate synthase/GTP cyclohydrolase II [Actinomycetota bacterium]